MEYVFECENCGKFNLIKLEKENNPISSAVCFECGHENIFGKNKKENLFKSIDVTNKVEFENSDDELLPITKCICGKKYDNVWDFCISINDGSGHFYQCESCGAKLYFSNSISVYQIVEG